MSTHDENRVDRDECGAVVSEEGATRGAGGMTDEEMVAGVKAWIEGMPPERRMRALAEARVLLLWLELNDPAGYAAVVRGDLAGAKVALGRLAKRPA